MKKIFIVALNELKRYFVSPVAYVYLLSFLVLNGSCALYFGDFMNRGEANLYAMFKFLPWIFLLFIPGISMRLWAEEFRLKTIVQLVSMPVSIKDLVLGKFFASWIFCALALFLTFTFWLTVNVLGNPDNSVIALGYAAGLVLAGCMLSISQTMSALTKNQVIALVLSVLANLLFFWSSVEYILSFFRLFLPDSMIDVIASFSFITHFSTMSRGVLELRDVIYFLSVIIFFNFTTVLIINFRTSGTSGWLKSTDKRYYFAAWTALFLSFFAINIMANNLCRNVQFDATEEKFFTLSDETKKILHNLKHPVMGKLYFSKILEQRNANLRLMFDNIRILLQKYKAESNSMFDYKVYYPEFLSDEEDIAIADGLQPIPLIDINQNALFGLVLEDDLQGKQVIPFFAFERTQNLEQDISEKIYRLHHKKKTVAVLSGLPIFGTTSDDGSAISARWKIIDLIAQNYNIINITKVQDFEAKFDVLMLVSPFGVKAQFAQKIKDYAANDGKILLILDPANESERLYSLMNNRLRHSDLQDLEEFFSIKFYGDYVVADLLNSITVDATNNYKTNPTFTQDVIQFKIKDDNMNPKHPITKNMGEIMFASAGVVMPQAKALQNEEISFVPLIKAGDVSQIMNAKVVYDGLNPKEILQYFQADENQKILAAEVRGKTKQNNFDMIVVADSDFIYDQFWALQKSLLESEYLVSEFDNADFVLNSLDYLTGNFDLIGLRGKKQKMREFKGMEIMRRLESLRFSKKEQDIFAQIETAKKAMTEVWNKKNFEERETFSADELAAIAKVRNNLNNLRLQLGKIRMAAAEQSKRIANLVTIFNIVLLPALFAFLLLLRFVWKKLKNRQLKIAPMRVDKRLGILVVIGVGLFAVSLASVYYFNKSSIDAYYGKKIFTNTAAHMNDINVVKLRNRDAKLTFRKNKNIWVLEEYPQMPVYQGRIRYLLTTLADATYFARKSDRAENLNMFHLAPLESVNSPVLEVELQNNDKTIEAFELGDINIDLGRGAKAAYVKFLNQFQVWEIKADFVDMNPNWQKWTYANLWDLRYGRLYTAKGIDGETHLLNFMKYMLNSPIEKVEDKMPKSKPNKNVVLITENGDSVEMSLYMGEHEAMALLKFAENNQNEHLRLVAKYYDGKTLYVTKENMEKILAQTE